MFTISMARMVFKCLEASDVTETTLIRTSAAHSFSEILRKYLENFSMECRSKICSLVRHTSIIAINAINTNVLLDNIHDKITGKV